MKITSLIILAFLGSAAFAHRLHQQKPSAPSEKPSVEILKKINDGFRNSIRPILDKKCGDCHTMRTQFPWYHSIPGIRQLMDKDVLEGRSHLDWTEGFPFKGHGTPEDDLREIQDSIQKGSMPPALYKLMHRSSTLNKEEKKSVLSWVEQSLKQLSSLPKK